MLARLLSVLLLATAGCLTPPAVFAVPTDLPAALATYPPGTEEVSIDLGGGARLHGVFVPAGPGAPVVLHLQEAGGSVAGPASAYGRLFARCRELGLASLCVDWAGVGRSTGHRSPWNLARDGRAMWREAVRRAGGPERVVVRALSLGTLAAGHLLEDGKQPAAWLLVVPVLAETATKRYAAAFHGALTAWVAGWAYRDLTDVHLPSALARATGPLVVVSSPEEVFLDADERELLARTTRARGGRWVEAPGGHFLVALQARDLFAPEIEVLVHLVGGPVAGEQDPTDFAARLAALPGVAPVVARAVAAESDGAPFGAAVLAAWRLASYGANAWPAEALAAYLSFDDPAGPLPRAAIEELRDLRDGCVAADVVYLNADARWLGRVTPWLLTGDPLTWTFHVSAGGAELVGIRWSTAPLVDAERGRSEADAERRILRGLLKIFRVPDRVVAGPDGPVVEAWESDAWHAVELGGERGGNFSVSFGGLTH